MNWLIQSYTTDTGGYFVTRRGSNDWVVLDPSATTHDGFSDENSAMAFAEDLDRRNAAPPDQVPEVNPTIVSANPVKL